MRTRHFRTFPSWATRIKSDSVPSFVSAVDLEVTEKFALLWLRKNDARRDSLYWKLTDVMLAMGITYAPPDFDALRAHGYATRGNDRLHRLTPSGIYKAQAIARDLGRQYVVHHVTLRPAAPRSNMGHFASCSCGEWQHVVGRSASDLRRLARLAQVHLHKFKSGTVPPLPSPADDAAEPENGVARTDVLRATPSSISYDAESAHG